MDLLKSFQKIIRINPVRDHSYDIDVIISWWHGSLCKDTLIIAFSRYKRRKDMYKERKSLGCRGVLSGHLMAKLLGKGWCQTQSLELSVHSYREASCV